MISMEQRLNYLDGIMAELAHAQMRTEIALQNLSRKDEELRAATIALETASREQGERFEEQGKRLEEIDRGIAATIAEMKEDTRRMKEDTRRMKEDTRRMKEDTRLMKKAWGDLANKMGTVAEDVVAPNIPRLAVEEFGFSEVLETQPRARRASRRGEKRHAEYDVVCAGPDKVAVVEVKSSPTLKDIEAAVPRLGAFFDFFPEYEGRELIGVLAGWAIDPALLPAISAAGLYGIAMGEDTMDVVARPARG